MSKENSRTITGKDLAVFLEVNPQKYISLYPNRERQDYCPCMDLGVDCHKMITVMDALTKGEISGFPEGTRKVTTGRYRSGQVWLDTFYDVAYLYIGKSLNGEDVALILGGDCNDAGSIEAGHINEGDEDKISFDKKVFPKK